MKEDGTTVEVDVRQETLNSDNVYCVVDEDSRSVYLWLGSSAGVRKRFVGARTAQKIRAQHGLHFRVHSLDEGSEDQNFLNSLQNETT